MRIGKKKKVASGMPADPFHSAQEKIATSGPPVGSAKILH